MGNILRSHSGVHGVQLVIDIRPALPVQEVQCIDHTEEHLALSGFGIITT